MEAKILERMAFHRAQAVKSLAGYKFWMAGYHMAQWVELNKLLADPEPNPFRPLVKTARRMALDPATGFESDTDVSLFCASFRRRFIDALAANEVFLAAEEQVPRKQSAQALGSVAASVLYHFLDDSFNVGAHDRAPEEVR